MGYKKGTREALIDNALNAVNKNLMALAQNFGIESNVYQTAAMKAATAYGTQHTRFADKGTTRGVVQIVRSKNLIDKIAESPVHQDSLTKLRKNKTVREVKKEYTDIAKKNVADFKKMNRQQKKEVLDTFIKVGTNVVAEYYAKYKQNGELTEEEEKLLEELEESYSNNGRETRALINDRYKELYEPYMGDDRAEMIKKIGFNPVVNKETGQIFSAEDAYNSVVKGFEDYANEYNN